MKKYVISGIQQVGIGVMNLQDAWKWYRMHFGMDIRIFEDKSEARLMLPYTGGEPQKRHAVLAFNLQSGSGFEIWQYTDREPVRRETETLLGDLGINACKIKTRDLKHAHDFYQKQDLSLLTDMQSGPGGEKSFFLKDRYGNLFQVQEASDWFRKEKKPTGGPNGVIIGVSDIDKAKEVYADILGYDKVVYDQEDEFADLQGLPGGEERMRRTLLARSAPFRGPFSPMLGNSFIELVSTSSRRPSKIYEGRYWGDPGFIHLCYDIQGMDELRSYCESKDYGFTVDSKNAHNGSSFDMGEAAGHFAYIEDPDGTLIEFVETQKVPLVKKWGWYVHVGGKEKGKSLPLWMLKALRFARVKD